ncbi:MAG: Ku protein [Desulfobaccales bacterium]
MKAVWKGYLKCSLVTIPIKMFNAVAKNSLQFHLYHQECGSQIRQEMICPVHQRSLTSDEVVRGYQYGKNLHVVITDEDLRRARPESSDTIEVLKFVDARQIDPIYYAAAHYLAPDGQAGAEAFALFYRAMEESGKSALAHVVMHNREHLVNLRPLDGVFAAFTLHYPEEIKGVREIEEAAWTAKLPVDEGNLEMARTIVEHLSGEFAPEQYHDDYTQTLLALIKAKAAGQELKVEPQAERRKVINLMEALKHSVAETAQASAPPPKKAMARAGRPAPKAAKAVGGEQ